MLGFHEISQTVKAWCKGRIWYGRALLLILFVYIGCRHFSNPSYSGVFWGINLGIHELGHLLFGFAGKFMTVAGGTILQLTGPIISAIMFVRQSDYFALCFSGVWLSTNLYNIAGYVGDARTQITPLVSVGGKDVIHDWYYLLSRMHILQWDTTIASFIRLLAFITMWGSIAVGIWMLWLMIRSQQ